MIEQKNLQYDVVSAGGGLSGVFAAAAAARTGAKTLLLERTGMLGGMAVQGIILREVYHQTELLDKFLSILKDLGGLYNLPAYPPGLLPVAINGETLKLALFRICRENSVDVLLYSEACSLDQHKGKVSGLRALAKNMFFQIEAPVVIDATGTGDLVRRSGVWHTESSLYAYAAVILTGMNPALLCHRWKQAFVQDGFAAGQPGAQYCGPLYAGSPVCTVTICTEPRRCLVEFPVKCQADSLNPLSRTQGIAEAHLKCFKLMETLNRAPGFEQVRLSSLPPQLILRQTPPGKALLPEASNIPENIAAAAIGETGAVQYFSLEDLALSQPGGLMVCGRLAAVYTHTNEMNTGTALATGEAAGVCGALAAQKGCHPREINASQIRETLELTLTEEKEEKK